MGISIDNSSLFSGAYSVGDKTNSTKNDALEKSLSNLDIKGSSDEEIMEACKSFETYFVEQVFKEMKKTVHSSDDEGEYMKYFGDMLNEEYAKNITESGGMGLAQTLYESMKRNV